MPQDQTGIGGAQLEPGSRAQDVVHLQEGYSSDHVWDLQRRAQQQRNKGLATEFLRARAPMRLARR